MSRSSKKGPFVEDRLMSRIEAMNATNENEQAALDQKLPHQLGATRPECGPHGQFARAG